MGAAAASRTPGWSQDVGRDETMRLLPTRRQWRNWTLPSKLTAISAYVSILALVLVIAFRILPLATRRSAVPARRVGAESSGPFSPAIVVTGLGSEVSVSYSFRSENAGKDAPDYELYYQSMKSPPDGQPPEEFYEMGFKNITDHPLLNFEFAVSFREPVESVTYDPDRSSSIFTGGEYLSSDRRRYHWRGNQVTAHGGWVVFVIRTKHPPPVISAISTDVPGVRMPGKELIPADPQGLPRD